MDSRPVYDALLLVSFGGPEGPDDVMPFLENVTAGRGVPPERLAEVAAHYDLFDGVSPINGHNRDLIGVLEGELDGLLPIYWGNRNWAPYLGDTVQRMADDGVRRALAFVTSAYGSYSSCRQYLEDIEAARVQVGDRAPVIDKIRYFYNHPGFIAAQAERLLAAVASAGGGLGPETMILFTAHSIPTSMAAGCGYVEQLREAAELVMAEANIAHPWELVFQSRSGPPAVPWLEPDIAERVGQLGGGAVDTVIVVPVGFVSDHMEVVYDLDVELASVAETAQVDLVRADTVGTHPRFVAMIRELVEERLAGEDGPRSALGSLGAGPDQCASNHCPPPRRPGRT